MVVVVVVGFWIFRRFDYPLASIQSISTIMEMLSEMNGREGAGRRGQQKKKKKIQRRQQTTDRTTNEQQQMKIVRSSSKKSYQHYKELPINFVLFIYRWHIRQNTYLVFNSRSMQRTHILPISYPAHGHSEYRRLLRLSRIHPLSPSVLHWFLLNFKKWRKKPLTTRRYNVFQLLQFQVSFFPIIILWVFYLTTIQMRLNWSQCADK